MVVGYVVSNYLGVNVNKQTAFQRKADRADRIVGICSAVIAVCYVILVNGGVI